MKNQNPGHLQKGDREDEGNYRPICSLPVLCKSFTTVLYARLAPSLHRVQPPNQTVFRPNHRCEDHPILYRVLEQRCREWCVPLYISTIDFTKAFDRSKHSAIWSSLQFYGIKPAYVRLLQRLYIQQEGTDLTDKESDAFPIKRGTKQGDPLSSLTVQHSVAIFSGKRSETVARKTKRNQTERQNRGLPSELEICRRCTTFLYVTGKIT